MTGISFQRQARVMPGRRPAIEAGPKGPRPSLLKTRHELTHDVGPRTDELLDRRMHLFELREWIWRERIRVHGITNLLIVALRFGQQEAVRANEIRDLQERREILRAILRFI